MKVAILTSNQQRHRFFIDQIANHFHISLLVTETKQDILASAKVQKGSEELMHRHLQDREQKEVAFFGNRPPRKDFSLLNVETGAVNSEKVYNELKGVNPDLVLLYGTSIIQEPLLTLFNGKIINMHLGLSPYYRGSGTNFWPLVNNQPECIGVTIHHAILKVDAGPILHQVRPNIQAQDGPHDIGCKSIMVGVAGLIQVLKKKEAGHNWENVQSLSGGLLYKRKDFCPEAIRKMHENFDKGMISTYLSEKSWRDNRYPLVDCEAANAIVSH